MKRESILFKGLSCLLVFCMLFALLPANAGAVDTCTVTFHGRDDLRNTWQEDCTAGSLLAKPTGDEYQSWGGGYQPEGWYTDSNYAAGSEWDFSTDTVTSDLDLYAKWTGKPYTLWLYVDYGDGPNLVRELAVAEGEDFVHQPYYFEGITSVSNPQYFAGWYDANDNFVTDGFQPYPITSNTVLYAIWKDKGKVQFVDSVGGTMTWKPEDIDTIPGGTLSMHFSGGIPVTTLPGYSLAGWVISNEDGTKIYQETMDEMEATQSATVSPVYNFSGTVHITSDDHSAFYVGGTEYTELSLPLTQTFNKETMTYDRVLGNAQGKVELRAKATGSRAYLSDVTIADTYGHSQNVFSFQDNKLNVAPMGGLVSLGQDESGELTVDSLDYTLGQPKDYLSCITVSYPVEVGLAFHWSEVNAPLTDVTIAISSDQLPEQYFMDFDTGTYGGLVLPPCVYNHISDGADYTLPQASAFTSAVKPDGSSYVLLGWVDDAECKSVQCIPDNCSKLPENMILLDATQTAHKADMYSYATHTGKLYHAVLGLDANNDGIADFQQSLHTVTFHGRIGMQNLVQKNRAAGSLLTEPMDFGQVEGWYTDSNYAAGSEWDFSTDTVTSDLDLYAKWTGKPYTLWLYVDRGNGPYLVREVAVADGEDFTKQPYYFDGSGGSVSDPKYMTGWYDANDNFVTDGLQSYPITSNMVLYSIWKDKPSTGGGSTGGGSTGGSSTGGGSTGGGSTGGSGVTSGATSGASGQTKLPFDDVSENSWYYANVQYVYSNQMMDGVGEMSFAPDVTTTRAMLITILWRMQNSPKATAPAQFSDVAASGWYAAAVDWAAEQEIVLGYDENTFAPDKQLSREELAAVLMRYASYCGKSIASTGSLSEFTDAKSASDWAVPALTWSVSSKILSGVDAQTLAPCAPATRAQVAAMLQRMEETVLSA